MDKFEIEKSIKKAFERDRKCHVDGCNEKSINSHFASRATFLSKISASKHYYCIRRTPLYDQSRSFTFDFEKKGITQVMSIQLFCSKHDNNLFAKLDDKTIDYKLHSTRILLSYRTVCAAIRQWQNNLDAFTNIGPTRTEELLIEKNTIDIYSKYKEALWNEYRTSDNREFEFNFFLFERVDVCVSHITAYESNSGLDTHFTVNIFPYGSNQTAVLIGYPKNNTDENLGRFVDFWRRNPFKEGLTYYMISFPENWVISAELYQTIAPSKIEAFKTFISDRDSWTRYKEPFSLFD